MKYLPTIFAAALTAAVPVICEAKEPARPRGGVLIKGVPHVKQKPDFCGEACVEMYLRKLGCQGMTQDDVFNRARLDPALGRGCYTKELTTAVKDLGFDPGTVGTWIPEKTADTAMAREWKKILSDLHRGIPSIVCMHFSDRPQTTEHFRLILGYDADAKEIIYHEPAVARGDYRRMEKETFFKLWPLKYRKDRWLLIRLRLKPGKIPKLAKKPAGFTAADYAQAVMKTRRQLPKGFTLILQKPFIVVGDETPKMVRRRSTGTVKWATDMLKKDYFKKDPKHIITIWLFKNKASYRKYTKAIFNDNPGTPFGYFSSRHNALIMNIATGGGTLVHEMVHPFVDTNFPKCPSWFNEGLASLYEQCGARRGKIMGFTNWRLAGLQKAIRNDDVPAFKTLCSTSTREFYEEDPGSNYSQARYLCYYLQQKGLLRKYYHAFAKNVDQDPTGYKTLKEVLGEKDMDDFKERWETWVMKLRFP